MCVEDIDVCDGWMYFMVICEGCVLFVVVLNMLGLYNV